MSAIGEPVVRREDPRLLRGDGRYLDDAPATGSLRAVFVRSPLAHARIVGIDAAASRASPGVVRVFLGEEFEAAGINDIEADTVPNRDGRPCPRPQRPLIAAERVRFVGEPVALVLAESITEARDAVELLDVEYDELPAVADTAQAESAGPPDIHAEAPGNLAFDWARGDEEAVDRALDGAAHRVSLELVNNRVAVVPLEPRGAIAEIDPADGTLRLAISGQGVWRTRDEVSKRLGIPPDRVQVTIGDVGGGFGAKAMTYPEYTAIAQAARVTGRRVRWIADRSESFLSDAMGRDHVTRAVAGFDKDLKLVALRVDSTVAMGAYLSEHGTIIPSVIMVKVLPGAYDFEHLFYAARGVYTNTTPVDAYRGAGRPEGIYVIERMMDRAARQFGVDPAELRARNLVPAAKFPFRNAAGERYDVGDYRKVLARCREEADLPGAGERRREAARRGRLHGTGLCFYVECILGATDERAALSLEADGCWELRVGTQSSGQGHATAYTQVLGHRMGIDPDRIRIVEGDSLRIPTGGGTGGSRSLTLQGTAIVSAWEQLRDRLLARAVEAMEVAAEDVAFEAGLFRVKGTDRTVSVGELASAAIHAGERKELAVSVGITLPERPFPYGCHACEVEIDPETGFTEVVRYTAVDDFGPLINPLIVEGQVHGGVAQGLGQALCEHAAYDAEGQPVTGTFMDYAMPRADGVPRVRFRNLPIPSTTNPLGVKGCGEAGTIGSLAAVVNAVLDALSAVGVEHIDMPLTPDRVWGWISAAGAEAGGRGTA